MATRKVSGTLWRKMFGNVAIIIFTLIHKKGDKNGTKNEKDSIKII